MGLFYWYHYSGKAYHPIKYLKTLFVHWFIYSNTQLPEYCTDKSPRQLLHKFPFPSSSPRTVLSSCRNQYGLRPMQPIVHWTIPAEITFLQMRVLSDGLWEPAWVAGHDPTAGREALFHCVSDHKKNENVKNIKTRLNRTAFIFSAIWFSPLMNYTEVIKHPARQPLSSPVRFARPQTGETLPLLHRHWAHVFRD